MVGQIAAAASAWEFGWEALVALGTIALAVVTGGLAFVTNRLARNSATELRAEWRPVLIPGASNRVALTINPPSAEQPASEILIRVRNEGRGAALFVRASLQPLGESPRNWSLGSIAADDEVTLLFFVQAPPPPFLRLALDYRDLNGRQYASALDIDTTSEPPRFYDVRILADRSITKLGDAVPEAGLDRL